MDSKRGLRSRFTSMKIKSRQLFSDQPVKVRPLAAQSCPFLLLPRELRDDIYGLVFFNTRVVFGRRGENVVKPAPYALALLRVCRQVHHEAQPLWLNRILICFEDTKTLLDKLCALELENLSQIRYMRTGGKALFLAPGTQVHRREYYSHAWALKFLPELSLDRLTVMGVPDGRENYHVLDELIKYGHGWRELHFFAPDSRMFGFARVARNVSTGQALQRRPQPRYWLQILRQQDGAESKCSVTIYRSSGNGIAGLVGNPEMRGTFEQIVGPDDLVTFGEGEDGQLMAKGEVEKEVLVVVKRGADADISGLDKPPYKDAEIKNWSKGRGWRKINREWTMPDKKFVPKKVEVDNYIDVEGFKWNYAEANPTS